MKLKDKWITFNEAAAYLGVSRTQIGLIASMGRLDHGTLDGRLVTTRAALDEYKANRKPSRWTGKKKK